MDRILPKTAEAYAKTAVFTAKTVPVNLLAHHSLKAGTWGCLTVEAGTVTFYTEGQDELVARLGAGQTLVIRPEERHFVAVADDGRFHIEFYR